MFWSAVLSTAAAPPVAALAYTLLAFAGCALLAYTVRASQVARRAAPGPGPGSAVVGARSHDARRMGDAGDAWGVNPRAGLPVRAAALMARGALWLRVSHAFAALSRRHVPGALLLACIFRAGATYNISKAHALCIRSLVGV